MKAQARTLEGRVCVPGGPGVSLSLPSLSWQLASGTEEAWSHAGSLVV